MLHYYIGFIAENNDMGGGGVRGHQKWQYSSCII